MGLFNYLTGFGGRDMAVDLGTANTLVYVRGRGASAYQELADDNAIAEEFRKHGRERFWDL